MSERRHLTELGLDSGWSQEDKQECLAASRKAYRQLKEKYGGRNVSVEDIPGFLDSVQRLLNEGYGLTDVGVMFGVSRERVRQWSEKYDLRRRSKSGTLYRIWDNDKNRFVPIPNYLMYHIAQYQHERRMERDAKRREEAARRQHIQAMKSLAKRFGRTPTLSELEEELDTAWPAIARHWGYDPESSDEQASYAVAYRNLCDSARVPPRKAGGAGHVS